MYYILLQYMYSYMTNICPFFLLQLEQPAPLSTIKACECMSFELTLSGAAMSWQSSKLGVYKQEQNRSINGRVFYYNNIKRQYLFWISTRGGYWMVSRIKDGL